MFIERMHDLCTRIRALIKGRKLDHDLGEELEFHLAMREQKLIEQGVTPQEAHYAARRGFGNVASLKETSREMWGFPLLESWLQDLLFGLRQLRRNPGFVALAIITLALGIGGTTAIFSVLYGGVLNPFPYADMNRLTMLISRDKVRQTWWWVELSAGEFQEYQRQNHVFDHVAGRYSEAFLLTGIEGPRQLQGECVTGNYFHVLGIQPPRGRALTPADAEPGSPPVAVLSHKVWQSYFGGDPGIIGRTIHLDRRPVTVVGIMSPRFDSDLDWEDIWLPVNPAEKSPRLVPHLYEYIVGHLKPRVSIKQAQADVAILAKRFSAANPKLHPPEVSITLEPFLDANAPDISRTLYFLLAAVGLLLLIVCVNVANLLLARATRREKELAIRAAIGASRARLVRQLTIESLMLAFSGALLGYVFAWGAQGALVAIIPEGSLPGEALIRLSNPVLLFTLGVTLACTLLFGMAPALITASRDMQEPLMASGKGSGESFQHHRLRNLLVVTEVALSLVLLTGAGSLIRSFVALREVKPGFNPDRVLVARFRLPADRYRTYEQRDQFLAELLRRVRYLPAVQSAAYGTVPIYWFDSVTVKIEGKNGVKNVRAHLRAGSDLYFATLGIPVLQGRSFVEKDLHGPQGVAVVNQAFFNTYFKSENPLGRRIKVPDDLGLKLHQPTCCEIVGVVADTKDAGPDHPASPTVFVPSYYGLLLVRTAGAPGLVLNPLRHEMAALDKELPIAWARPMQEVMGFWYAKPRFFTTILVAFASLGLVLVSVGVYSVLAYAVSQRTNEIGVRMALGAQVSEVRRMVLKWGLRWLAIGIGIGIPASIALEKVLRNRIWGIKSADPMTMVAVSLVLMLVGLLACYIPARRAAKVDPMVALRHE